MNEQLSIFDYMNMLNKGVEKKNQVKDTKNKTNAAVRQKKVEVAEDITKDKALIKKKPLVHSIGQALKDKGYTKEHFVEVFHKQNFVYYESLRDDTEIRKVMNKVTAEIEKFLEEEFQLTLEVPVQINNRLSRSLGLFRYILYSDGTKKAVSIELSKRLLEYGRSYKEIVKIALHEALHYALFVLGKDHSDGDETFERLLRHYDLPSTNQITEVFYNKKWYVYMCECKEGDNFHFLERSFSRKKTYYCTSCEEVINDTNKIVIEGTMKQ